MNRPRTRAAARGALITLLALGTGCGRDADQAYDSIFTQPVTLTTANRREFELGADVPPFRYPDIENPDGSVTRILWVDPGQGKPLLAALDKHPTLTALKHFANQDSFFKDPLLAGAPSTNEGLLMTGTRDQVNAATELINYIITSLPLIEIEARVVEVKQSDEFGFGIDYFLLNNSDHAFDPANPNAPLSPSSTFFDRGRRRPGIPALPDGTTASPLLLDLGTITNGLQIDMLVQALKVFTKADVLSAPRIAVLDGFRAEFKAGEDIPIFTQNVFGPNVTITTTFRPIGIKLVVTPRLVSRETIRMGVKTTVENVTGASTVNNGGTIVSNPIISVREATTTVDVRNGAAVVIGGLFTTSKIDIQDRVPILGEIPILNVLFSSTHSEDRRSNLLFFIRPRLISPAGDVGGAVITPPFEPPPAGPPSDGK